MTQTASLLERFPQLRERFTMVGGDHADTTANELMRFFELTRSSDGPLAMVSPQMDLMWHTFIEFTEDYGRFCNETYREFIHHRPRTAATPVQDEAVRNFYCAYEARFGPLPDIWNKDVPAEVQAYGKGHVAYLPDNYRWSGWPGR